MPYFSQLPAWDSLHPVIIHFPMVLLLLSPVLLLIGATLSPHKSRPYLIMALLALLLGTASLFVATSSGEAVGELTDKGGAVKMMLESHKELASDTKVIFSMFSAILLGIVVLPRALHRQKTRLYSTLLPIAFLALYSVGILYLDNTAHEGGRLAHELRVDATLPASGTVADASTPAAREQTKHDKD